MGIPSNEQVLNLGTNYVPLAALDSGYIICAMARPWILGNKYVQWARMKRRGRYRLPASSRENCAVDPAAWPGT